MRGSSGSVLRRTLFVLVILGLAGAGVAWQWERANGAQSRFQTAAVKRGELLATVSATGTVEPEEVVDVGTQVNGMVQQFGGSGRLIDYGSAVEEGTVLARIDDSLFRARLDKAISLVEQNKAQIAQADADLQRAAADRKQVTAKNHLAQRDLQRADKLLKARALSQEDYDIRRSDFEVTDANLGVAQAAVEQAKAAKARALTTLAGAEADRREAQRNLDYTTIRSPVKGVIVDRRVNIGQTVVASLNSPSLFLIAKDLKRMQVWASVNEADIGRIKPGQTVRFTVDTYPGEEFQGEVGQVRLNATMTQNVVTYTVVVNTDNSLGRLLPYLTANLKFEIDRRDDVLMVPNAALRWQPRPEQIAPDARAAVAERKSESASKTKGGSFERKSDRGMVWTIDEGLVRPVEVKFGLSDGVSTEVSGDDVSEDMEVVTGEVIAAPEDSTASPFATPMFRGRRSQ